MAARRTQKKAPANARRAPGKRGSGARASSHTRSATVGRPSGSRSTHTPAKKKTRKPGSGRAATIAIVAAIIVAAWTVYPVLRIQYQQQREVQSLETELTSLEDRNAELRQQVDELKTPEGVERVARESLGMVKPGEQAYVVTGGMSGETSVTVPGSADDTRSLARRILDAVFGFE
ncbi:MAG: septum formation initiator family protein [Coriobacteriia bacterium]|nr:septum formation initiator family protein [Coriobacteriia bacterium]